MKRRIWRGRSDRCVRCFAHSQGSEVSIRERGAALDRSLQTSALALIVALDEGDADKVETIRKALRPLDALRVQLARERGGAGGLGAEVEVDEEALAELLAEEQAVAEAIDIEAIEEAGEG